MRAESSLKERWNIAIEKKKRLKYNEDKNLEIKFWNLMILFNLTVKLSKNCLIYFFYLIFGNFEKELFFKSLLDLIFISLF